MPHSPANSRIRSIVISQRLLPTKDGVSWESHFFGFLSGILASYLLAKRQAPTASLGIPKRETTL